MIKFLDLDCIVTIQSTFKLNIFVRYNNVVGNLHCNVERMMRGSPAFILNRSLTTLTHVANNVSAIKKLYAISTNATMT